MTPIDGWVARTRGPPVASNADATALNTHRNGLGPGSVAVHAPHECRTRHDDADVCIAIPCVVLARLGPIAVAADVLNAIR